MLRALSRVVDRLLRWRSFTLPVCAVLFAYTFLLYRRALGVGILSDGWELLGIGSLGMRKAPFVLLSYHTIPVTNFFVAVLWKLFGLHETLYQILNIAELALVACLLYALANALFGQPRVGLLAALLFLSNSSFYEVPFWPVIGNFQSLTALLYLGGLLAVLRARRARPHLWAAVFGLTVLAAFFAYEPAVSLLPVGLLLAALGGGTVRRLGPFLAPSLGAAGVVVASKLLTTATGHTALFLPDGWHALQLREYQLVRGCIAILSLRGADGALYRMMTFGLTPPGEGLRFLACLGLWLAGLTAGGVLAIRRTRTPAVRFLVLWFAVHMLTVSAATLIVSRHFYLGALPAALLTAWLLWKLADHLATAWARRGGAAALGISEPQMAVLAVFLLLTVGVTGAKSDLDSAAAVAKEGTRETRRVVALVRERLSRGGAPPRVALVNMPAILVRDGVNAFTFVNGLTPQLRLATGGRIEHPDLLFTYAELRDGKLANGSRAVSLSELAGRVGDPGSLVLLFDGRTRTVVPVDRLSWRLPESYTADTAPYFEWQSGAWPWLRVYAGQPLALSLAVQDEGEDGRWAALRFLRGEGGARFTVSFSDGGGGGRGVPDLTIRAPETAEAHWPAVVFPLGAGGSPAHPAHITLRPDADLWIAGLWSFVPPSSYTTGNAPFLSWKLDAEPAFKVAAPLLLPLAAPRLASCACPVHFEVLAEPGRELAVGIDGGPLRQLDFGGVAAPEWRSLEIAAPSPGRMAVLRIEPRGRLGALVRRLGRTRLPAPCAD